MNTDIKHKIRAFMCDEFKESGFHDGIADDASLIETSVLDSLSILKLISFMDDEFGVMPSDDELNPERLASINLIAELIARKSKPGL